MKQRGILFVLGGILTISLAICSFANISNGYSPAPPPAEALQREIVVVAVSRNKGMDTYFREHTVAQILDTKPTNGSISSEFGMRKLSSTRKARHHNGIDVSARKGTPVLASGDGTIVFAGYRSSYGKLVEIEHAQGVVTRYAHLDKFVVKKGQQVEAGQKVGTVGTTGRVTGPHLHFEVLVGNKHVDPLAVVAWS